MTEYIPIKKYSDAYQTLMLDIDRLRTISKFYPWVVRESKDLLGSNPQFLEEFLPGITLEESFFKIDKSAHIVLQFCIIHLVSIFQDYLSSAVRELLNRNLPLDSPDFIAKEDEPSKDLQDEYTSDRERFIATEIRNFGFASWPKKLNYLEKRFSFKFPDNIKTILRIIIDTRNLLVHNPTSTSGMNLEIDQEIIENNMDNIVYASSLVEELISSRA